MEDNVEETNPKSVEFNGSGSIKIELGEISLFELSKILGCDMETLRNEYKGLGLSDEQIVQAKSLNLTPGAMRSFITYFQQLAIGINIIIENVATALRGFIQSEEGKKLENLLTKAESFNEFEFKRNEKGKPLKPWEKKNFYQ